MADSIFDQIEKKVNEYLQNWQGGDASKDTYKDTLKWYGKRCYIEDPEGWETVFGKYWNEIKGDQGKIDDQDIFKRCLSDHMCENDREKRTDKYWREFEEKRKTDTALTDGLIQMIKNYRDQGVKDRHLKLQLGDFAKDINNDNLRFVYEIIQNADDCDYDECECGPYIIIEIDEDNKQIKCEYNEKGFSYSDILAITTLGQSNKLSKKKEKIIGEKGIGFKTIFKACKVVEVFTGPFHFKLENMDIVTDDDNKYEKKSGTQLICSFRDDFDPSGIYENLIEKYGIKDGEIDASAALGNCPVLFTNKLRSITLKRGNDSVFIGCERKGEERIIKYKLSDQKNLALKCISVSIDVQMTRDEYFDRYPDVFTKEEWPEDKDLPLNDIDAVKYPVSVIIPTPESMKSDKDIYGNLFTYLPTYTMINAPISVQIPFKLNLDRSCVDIKEENRGLKTLKWNEHLFREVFEYNEKKPCLLQKVFEEIKRRGWNPCAYLPYYDNDSYTFFRSPDEQYDKSIKNLNEWVKELAEESKNDLIFETIKRIEFLKPVRSDSRSWVRPDETYVFDEVVEGILGNDRLGVLQDILCEDEEASEKYAVSLSCINKKKVLLQQLGMEIYKTNDKAAFINRIMTVNDKIEGEVRDRVLEACVEEKKSDYLPRDEKISEIKVIHDGEEYLAWNERKYWVSLKDDNKKELKGKGTVGVALKTQNKDIFDIFYPNKDAYIIFMDDSSDKNLLDIFVNNKNRRSTDPEKKDFISLLYLMREMEGADNIGIYEYTKKLLTEDSKDNLKIAWEMAIENGLLMSDDDWSGLNELKEYDAYRAIEIIIADCVYRDGRNRIRGAVIEKSWLCSADICDALNETDFDSDLFELGDYNSDNRFWSFEDLPGDYRKLGTEKLFVYEDLNTEYVHFNRTIIFKDENSIDDKKIKEKCLDSVMAGFSALNNSDNIIEILRNKTDPLIGKKDNDKDEKKDLDAIRDACALHAKYSMDTRNSAGSGNTVWYELLQNADDHFRGYDDGYDFNSEELSLVIDQDEKNRVRIVLEYPDRGFSSADFVAVCTSGNSVSRKKTDVDVEGRKGTGFKSVYNYFDKVVIGSNGWKCTLEDRPVKVSIIDGKVIVDRKEELEWTDEGKRYYPVPDFEKDENIQFGKTRIELFFITNDKYEEFFDTIVGEDWKESPEDLEKKIKECFERKGDAYFLRRIQNICLNGISFKGAIKENDENMLRYEIEDKDFLFNEEEPDRLFKVNPIWKDIYNDEGKKNKAKNKSRLELIFPKEIKNTENRVYCTLPIEGFKLNVPFYINIPLLELNDERNDLAQNVGDGFDLKKWNEGILERVLTNKDSLFARIYIKLAEDCLKGDVKYTDLDLLRWFPVGYLKNVDLFEKYTYYKCLYWDDCLKNIPFIRATKGEIDGKVEYEMVAIDRFGKDVYFLPDYLYEYFLEKKGLDGFHTDEYYFVYTENSKEYVGFIKEKIYGGSIPEDKMISFDTVVSFVAGRQDCWDLLTSILKDLNKLSYRNEKNGNLNNLVIEFMKEHDEEACGKLLDKILEEGLFECLYDNSIDLMLSCLNNSSSLKVLEKCIKRSMITHEDTYFCSLAENIIQVYVNEKIGSRFPDILKRIYNYEKWDEKGDKKWEKAKEDFYTVVFRYDDWNSGRYVLLESNIDILWDKEIARDMGYRNIYPILLEKTDEDKIKLLHTRLWVNEWKFIDNACNKVTQKPILFYPHVDAKLIDELIKEKQMELLAYNSEQSLVEGITKASDDFKNNLKTFLYLRNTFEKIVEAQEGSIFVNKDIIQEIEQTNKDKYKKVYEKVFSIRSMDNSVNELIQEKGIFYISNDEDMEKESIFEKDENEIIALMLLIDTGVNDANIASMIIRKRLENKLTISKILKYMLSPERGGVYWGPQLFSSNTEWNEYLYAKSYADALSCIEQDDIGCCFHIRNTPIAELKEFRELDSINYPNLPYIPDPSYVAERYGFDDGNTVRGILIYEHEGFEKGLCCKFDHNYHNTIWRTDYYYVLFIKKENLKYAIGISEEYEAVKDVMDKIEDIRDIIKRAKNGEKDSKKKLLKCMIQGYRQDKTKYDGYKKGEFFCCPICGAELRAQMSQLRIYWLAGEYPCAVCKNCEELFDRYVEGVQIENIDLEQPELRITMKAKDKKKEKISITMNLSESHRRIWEEMKKLDD